MEDKRTKINSTIAYIESHIEENLMLDDIAKQIGYSKFYLNKLFSEVVGCTIHNYIKNRRLTIAADKLVHTNLSIAEIAYDTGYETQQAFTLAFKQLHGHTPHVYRSRGIYRSKQDKIILLSKPSALTNKTINCGGIAA